MGVSVKAKSLLCNKVDFLNAYFKNSFPAFTYVDTFCVIKIKYVWIV